MLKLSFHYSEESGADAASGAVVPPLLFFSRLRSCVRSEYAKNLCIHSNVWVCSSSVLELVDSICSFFLFSNSDPRSLVPLFRQLELFFNCLRAVLAICSGSSVS